MASFMLPSGFGLEDFLQLSVKSVFLRRSQIYIGKGKDSLESRNCGLAKSMSLVVGFVAHPTL